ncbi:hypothetical protein B566_EDAN017886 [Ephemera danica]|nr:hypothetical protein B566_EDAN017886 [Ephemera danica]
MWDFNSFVHLVINVQTSIIKMSEASAVQSFFRGCGIFITGATGFLGMGLVEKLLRCCPDSGPIFLLVRPKKEKSIQERLEEVTKNK